MFSLTFTLCETFQVSLLEPPRECIINVTHRIQHLTIGFYKPNDHGFDEDTKKLPAQSTIQVFHVEVSARIVQHVL
jgi:hypothetical protein